MLMSYCNWYTIKFLSIMNLFNNNTASRTSYEKNLLKKKKKICEKKNIIQKNEEVKFIEYCIKKKKKSLNIRWMQVNPN